MSHFQYWDPMDLVMNRGRRDLALVFQFIASLAMGRIGGRLVPGREWALALMFTFVSACITLPEAWYVLVGLRIVLAPLTEFMIAAARSRLSGFWAGSLWIRQSRNNKSLTGCVS
jgi:hypothetical protein